MELHLLSRERLEMLSTQSCVYTSLSRTFLKSKESAAAER